MKKQGKNTMTEQEKRRLKLYDLAEKIADKGLAKLLSGKSAAMRKYINNEEDLVYFLDTLKASVLKGLEENRHIDDYPVLVITYNQAKNNIN